nr:vegetative cell wall protein gp1-like [Aegilops tauschii subsp. strangulata]
MAPSRLRARSSPRPPPSFPYNLRSRSGRIPGSTNLVSRDSGSVMSSPSPTPPLPSGTTASLSAPPMTTNGAPTLPGPSATAGAPTPSAPIPPAPTPPAPVTTAPPLTAVFTPEQMTSTLQQLVTAVQGLHMNQYHQYMAGAYGFPPAASIATYGHPAPWLFPGAPAGGEPPLLSFQTRNSTATPIQPPLLPLQPAAPPLPSSGAPSPTGLPIHQVWFPPSPSPLPAWAAGSSPSSAYTTAPEQPTPFPQFGGPSGSTGPYLEYSDQAPPASLLRTYEPARHGAPTQTPPRFAKIDFATYDGMEDPLNWLNQ